MPTTVSRKSMTMLVSSSTSTSGVASSAVIHTQQRRQSSLPSVFWRELRETWRLRACLSSPWVARGAECGSCASASTRSPIERCHGQRQRRSGRPMTSLTGYVHRRNGSARGGRWRSHGGCGCAQILRQFQCLEDTLTRFVILAGGVDLLPGVRETSSCADRRAVARIIRSLRASSPMQAKRAAIGPHRSAGRRHVTAAVGQHFAIDAIGRAAQGTSSRKASKLPLRKKFFDATSACFGRYTLPCRRRSSSSSGGKSTTTTSSKLGQDPVEWSRGRVFR